MAPSLSAINVWKLLKGVGGWAFLTGRKAVTHMMMFWTTLYTTDTLHRAHFSNFLNRTNQAIFWQRGLLLLLLTEKYSQNWFFLNSANICPPWSDPITKVYGYIYVSAAVLDQILTYELHLPISGQNQKTGCTRIRTRDLLIRSPKSLKHNHPTNKRTDWFRNRDFSILQLKWGAKTYGESLKKKSSFS